MMYYNEPNKDCAVWLKEAMREGIIGAGDVDQRFIQEIDPNDLKGYTQHHFFAGIGGWAIALRLAGWDDARPVWTGSCPCFPSGTLVLSSKGIIPIESISVGDMVWTHQNRWRKVLSTGSDYKEVGILKGHGHYGLVTTSNHPFLSLDRKIRNARKNGHNKKIYEVSEPAWVNAENMPSRWWCMPSHYPETAFTKPLGIKLDMRRLMLLAGFYVGDGWIDKRSDVQGIVLGLSESKTKEFLSFFEESGVVKVHKEATCNKVRYRDKAIAHFFSENFGQKSLNKRIPSWVLFLDDESKHAFLQGWHLTDGTRRLQKGSMRLTTTSRNLAIVGRMLLVSMGYAVSMRKVVVKKEKNIQGRLVHQNDYYVINYSQNTRYKIEIGDHAYQKAKSWAVRDARLLVKVYNIEVENDNSYTADGIIVHNCQPFSVAGKQQAQKDDRHLWPYWYRLIREYKPATVFAEQVTGAIAFGWLDQVADDLEAEGYAFGAVVLPACSVGAPHKRDRLWFLGNSQHDGQSTRTHQGIVGSDARSSKEGQECTKQSTGAGNPAHMADTHRTGLEGHRKLGYVHAAQGRQDASRHFAESSMAWIECPDGKQRAVEPSICLLVDGIPSRLRKAALQGYGNAIVPQVAAEFIKAYMETTQGE